MPPPLYEPNVSRKNHSVNKYFVFDFFPIDNEVKVCYLYITTQRYAKPLRSFLAEKEGAAMTFPQKTHADPQKMQVLAKLIADGLEQSEPDMLAVLKALQLGYVLGEMKAAQQVS